MKPALYAVSCDLQRKTILIDSTRVVKIS